MNNTVCLCGSTRFLNCFEDANIELTKRGLSVITVSMCLPRNQQDEQADASLKVYLDLIHLNKILRADAVFVVGDGYYGESTAREILWADMQSRPIITQASIHSWDNAAYMIRASCWSPAIVVDARRKLGIP